MISKKEIQNRIRGWFPQEPRLPKAPVKTDFQTNPPPLLNAKPAPPQMGPGTLRATRFLGFQALIWIILSFLFVIQLRGENQISLTSQIIWITAGLIVGLTVSAIFTQRQIGYFEKNSQFPTPKAGPLFATIVGAVIIIMVVVYGSFFFNLQAIGAGFLSSIAVMTPTAFAARYLLFSRYERKKEIYIIQYWWQAGIFALPKRAPVDVS